MKELDKALKSYWYDQGFDKMVSHWEANTELNVFAKGWKTALEWVLSRRKENIFTETEKELEE